LARSSGTGRQLSLEVREAARLKKLKEKIYYRKGTWLVGSRGGPGRWSVCGKTLWRKPAFQDREGSPTKRKKGGRGLSMKSKGSGEDLKISRTNEKDGKREIKLGNGEFLSEGNRTKKRSCLEEGPYRRRGFSRGNR